MNNLKMKKVIYIDFDGVLVDTPKFINEEIKSKGASEETFKNFPWNYFLQNCNEIENNLTTLKKISKKNKVVILTHVYSHKEKLAKQKFISEKLNNIKIITVPYYIDKNIIVNPKGNILIDDYRKNIDKWINSGGIGIKFKNEKRIDRLLIDYIKS